MQIKGGGSNLEFTLTDAPEGTIAVRLELGQAVRYCATAVPQVDTATKFKAIPWTPPPSSCPSLP